MFDKQVVAYIDEWTKPRFVKVIMGVTQRCILGPLLFLMYIHDIVSNAKSKIKLFADDSVIYKTMYSTSVTGML